MNTITKFTMKALNTAVGATWFGNQRVDLIVTTQAIWDLIFDKLLPNQKFEDSDSEAAKAGFRVIRWCGIQIVVDQYCPAGYIFGLNTAHMNLWITTLQKYQSTFQAATVQKDRGKPSLIDSNAAMPTRPKAVLSHGERLSERASHVGDAIVRAARNENLQSMAEMTMPLAA